MFEDDGCAAFGRLDQKCPGLGPIGEVDGEAAEALAERWERRYAFPVTPAEAGVHLVVEKEEDGCRVEPGMTGAGVRAHG